MRKQHCGGDATDQRRPPPVGRAPMGVSRRQYLPERGAAGQDCGQTVQRAMAALGHVAQHAGRRQIAPAVTLVRPRGAGRADAVLLGAGEAVLAPVASALAGALGVVAEQARARRESVRGEPCGADERVPGAGGRAGRAARGVGPAGCATASSRPAQSVRGEAQVARARWDRAGGDRAVADPARREECKTRHAVSMACGPECAPRDLRPTPNVVQPRVSTLSWMKRKRGHRSAGQLPKPPGGCSSRLMRSPQMMCLTHSSEALRDTQKRPAHMIGRQASTHLDQLPTRLANTADTHQFVVGLAASKPVEQ